MKCVSVLQLAPVRGRKGGRRGGEEEGGGGEGGGGGGGGGVGEGRGGGFSSVVVYRALLLAHRYLSALTVYFLNVGILYYIILE